MGIINAILPIVILILLGWILKHYWIKDESFWENVNKLVYYILFPALIILDISRTSLSGINLLFIVVLIATVVSITAIIWLAKPLFRQTSFWLVFTQGAVRHNSYVFIGVAIYYIGEQIMPIVVLITLFLVITGNLISILLLDIYAPKRKKRNAIKSILAVFKKPLILACIFGLIINRLAIHIPAITHNVWLNNTLEHISDASLPLSLIGVGASLSVKVSFRFLEGALLCSLIKLIILPGIVILALKMLHFNDTIIQICMIYAACPCNTNATAMNQSMGGDYKSMSLIISLQTLLSAFTLTIWLLLFPYL